MAKAKLTPKKDFGLGKYRITLPESEENESYSESSTPEMKPKTKSTASPLPFRVPGISSITGRVKSLLQKPGSKGTGGSPEMRGSPVLREKVLPEDLINLQSDDGSSGKPSPILHSRVVQKGHLGSEGVKGSLDNLIDTYGLMTGDGTLDVEGPDHRFVKLLLRSGNNNHQVTFEKSPEGLGIRISSGQSPVFVTQVEPDSEAMLAGIKVDDVILEVNGRDCRTLGSSQISHVLQLKSLIKNSPNWGRSTKESLTISSIDSNSDDSDDVFTPSKHWQQDEDSSIDESMFEHSEKVKDTFKPMPLLKEENSVPELLLSNST